MEVGGTNRSTASGRARGPWLARGRGSARTVRLTRENLVKNKRAWLFSTCLLGCGVDVDPLDYGCTALWQRNADQCFDGEAFAAVVQADMWREGEEVMGFAFAAGDEQGALVKGACGLARTDKDGGVRVFEPDMVIESGSTSKMFTAVAALRVLELRPEAEGLDTAMNDHLPAQWAPHAALAEADLTMGQLLQHRSGIINTGGIGLRPVLLGPEWFDPFWVGRQRYANHNLDAVGFMTAYLGAADELEQSEQRWEGHDDYDREINIAVRNAHLDLLDRHAVRPVGLDLDCIRFGAETQKVWLYADAKDQRGYKLPARSNCMTSGFLVSAPQWVEWAAALYRGELLGNESLGLLYAWDGDRRDALGWSGGFGDVRSHGGGYSPQGVGVRTSLVVTRDGFAASVVANSANAPDPVATATDALYAGLAPCQ